MLSILLNSYIHTEIIVSLLCAEIIYLIMIFGFKSKFSIDYNTDYRNSMFFLIGIFILFLALVWPVHYISEYYLFSAHMLQHVMISYIAPPLLISGINYKILDSFLRLKYFNNIAKFLFLGFGTYLIFMLCQFPLKNFMRWSILCLFLERFLCGGP